jgi:hypothetical protein
MLVTEVHKEDGMHIAEMDVVTTDEAGTKVLTGQAAARLDS